MIARAIVRRAGLAAVALLSLALGGAASASANGGDSERQSLLAVDADSYTVLSVEWLGHWTYFRHTNRISLKRYALDSNAPLGIDVLLETVVDRDAEGPPGPTVSMPSDAPTTTLRDVLGGRTDPFAGYVRRPRRPLRVDAGGIFTDRDGRRVPVMSARDLVVRVPDFVERAEGDAFEVVGVQGGPGAWFVVVRSGGWGADTGSFEQVIAIPEAPADDVRIGRGREG